VVNDWEVGAYDQAAFLGTSHTGADPVDREDIRWGEACPDSSAEVASIEGLQGSNAAAALEAEYASFSFLFQWIPQAQGPTSILCRLAQSSERPGVGRGCGGHYSANLSSGHGAYRTGISSQWHDIFVEVT